MTQADLSDALGVVRTAIGAYESGASYPSMQNILTLSALFDINIDDLFKKDLSRELGRPASPSSATQAEKTTLQAEVIQLLKTRVRELEREILRKDPEWARELGIE